VLYHGWQLRVTDIKLYVTKLTQEDNGIWRIKTNKELDELINQWNIINYIKAQRLSWVGHISRMLGTSILTEIYKWKPSKSRWVGRPKSRWEDDIRNDLRKMELKKCTEQIQDRLK